MKCVKCQQSPNEIGEYIEAAHDLGISIDQYVKQEEGTFDRETDLFCCTGCYIALNMPLFPDLKRAYLYYRNHIEKTS